MSAMSIENRPMTGLTEAVTEAPRVKPEPDKPRHAKAALIAGRTLNGLAVAFLGFDAVVKLLQLQPALDATAQLGYPESAVFGLGLIEAACLVVLLVPRTAALGAILWTGYLGGAIASHLRLGHPLFSHVLFPIYIAALIWGGSWLRDERVRRLLAPRARG